MNETVVSQVNPPGEPDADDENENENENETEAETEAPSGFGVESDTDGEPVIPDGHALCPACFGAGVIPKEVRQDPQTARCEMCAGVGQVLTGSLNPEFVTRPCTNCNGTGHSFGQPTPESIAVANMPQAPPLYLPSVPVGFHVEYDAGGQPQLVRD